LELGFANHHLLGAASQVEFDIDGSRLPDFETQRLQTERCEAIFRDLEAECPGFEIG
jgi:hypothetical protein